MKPETLAITDNLCVANNWVEYLACSNYYQQYISQRPLDYKFMLSDCITKEEKHEKYKCE